MTESLTEFEHAGLTVKIKYDDDAFHLNPRNNDEPLGRMVSWVDGFQVGGDDDEILRDEPDFTLDCEPCEGTGEDPYCPELPPAGPFPTYSGCQVCEASGVVEVDAETYFRKVYGAALLIPLRFSDYGSSGCNLSETDADQANAVIYMTEDELQSEFPIGYEFTDGVIENAEQQRERARESLLLTVKEYDDWAQGNVFAYVIEDDGEELESCWGFIGDPWPEDAYVKQAAREAADGCRTNIEAEQAEREFWAARDVQTV